MCVYDICYGPYKKPGSINAARAVLILTGGAGSINAAHLFAHGHIKTRAVSKLSVTVKQQKLWCIITGKH